MKGKLITGVMLTLLLASVMASAIVVQPVKSEPTTTVSLDPSTTTVRPNTNFTVNLNITDVTDLVAWSVVLEWDPSLLELVNATKGSFCEEWSWYDDLNQSEGAYTLLSNDPMAGAGALSGSGTLAELEFHTITQGQCALTLAATSLINASSILKSTPPYLGDANGDMIVDPLDLTAVMTALGWEPYNANADFNSDGKIDAYDVWCVILNWMTDYNSFPQAYKPVEIPHQVYHGTVKVEATHDVSVTNVALYKTVIGQGYTVSLKVTVENQGDFTESFYVTAYYGEVTIITSEQRDTFWSMGDVNKDGHINGTDGMAILTNWHWTGPPGGNLADINSDGTVDGIDLGIYTDNEGLVVWTYFGISGVIDTQEIVNLYPRSPAQWDVFWSLGDVNRDGYINQTDMDIIQANWLWTGPPGGNLADINSDGTVDGIDMNICVNNQGLYFWTFFHVVAVITFTWNTTGVAKGNHTIKAAADTVSGEGDTSDNILTDGSVKVTIPGDVTEDELIWADMQDIDILIAGFMATPRADGKFWHTPPCDYCPHSPNCDANSDNSIDMADIQIAIDNFMQT